jgi:hypothetical protein
MARREWDKAESGADQNRTGKGGDESEGGRRIER